jgi:hypothetical protein
MQLDDVQRDTIRRLSEVQVDDGLVLSVYLNLDPREFATAPARATAITSLLDEADRRARDAGGVSPGARAAAREDVRRARALLDEARFDGAHALAVFCSQPAELLAAYKLPRPAGHGVMLARSPWVEPLVELEAGGRWAILLANRSAGRILRGSRDRLAELPRVEDETLRRHDQGGWSQARLQRWVDRQATEHLDHVTRALYESFKRAPFDRLILACPEELHSELHDKLHPDLRRRLAGRIELDVKSSSPDAVLERARPVIEEDEHKHESELIERVRQGVGANGHGAAGVDDVLAALNEHRVEALLLARDFAAEGRRCPSCGWLGAGEAGECPADGTALDPLPDLREGAVEAAVRQAAEVLVVRERPDLGPLGGIAAVLRF